MESTIENIKKALKKVLPGSASHRKFLPPSRTLTVDRHDTGKLKRSSVMLLLFEENEELYACLIKRTGHMKFHPGQIAFPGGRIEPGETAPETALRETFEEIGIEPADIEIAGPLSELYVSVSQFLIQPFVGWLKKKPHFSINPHEVEKLIFFPLFKYRNFFENVEVDIKTQTITVPCIRFENEIIWGATAMILAEFYDITDENILNSNS
jgi:8-oxo-dGTP pyrophosphatase MutT (NUDIX family)